MNAYKTLWAALRSRFNADDCKLVLDEASSNAKALYGRLSVGEKNIQFAFMLRGDVLLVLSTRELPCPYAKHFSLNGYEDSALKDKPADYLEKFVSLLWEGMDEVIKADLEFAGSVTATEQKKQENIEEYIGTARRFSFSCKNQALDYGYNTVFCKKLPSEQATPAIKRQDVNHNQEVLYALVNESLGNQEPIFDNHELDEIVHSQAKTDLEQYRMYGMLLWDEKQDTDIECLVNKKYSSLQEAAGDYFKLMALFSRSKHIYRRDDAQYHWDEIFSDVKLQITDDAHYVHVFLDALGVAEQNVPYLVLTDDFKSDKILLVPLHGQNLLRLVERIGEIAKDGKVSLKTYQENLLSMGCESGLRDLEDRSVAKRLFAPLTGIMQNSKTGIRAQAGSSIDRLLEDAKESMFYTHSIMQQAYEKIDKLDHGSVEYQEHMDKYTTLCMEQLNMSVMQVEQVVDCEKFGFSLEMIRGLHDESRRYLETAIRAIGVFEYFRNDLSPIIVVLGKVLENEVNRSLVQFIRKRLKIAMPDYYCRLYPANQGESYLLEKADFNRKNGEGVWLAPECGCSQTVVDKHDEIWDGLSNDYSDLLNNAKGLTHKALCKEWRTVCVCRNAAAHPNESGCTLTNLIAIQNALLKLDEMGGFSFMKNLRDRLNA